jgi:hypothetical protein
MARKKPGPPAKRGRPFGIRIQGEHGCRTCQHPELPRINFLSAQGATPSALAAQFGLSRTSIIHHHRSHITARYKRIVGGSRLDSFEALLTKAAEGDAESLDILNLLIRGHTQAWAVDLDSGDTRRMSINASRILQAVELRAKITRELTGTPTIQMNTFLTHDAAQLVQVLEHFPEAAEAVLQWHTKRTNTTVAEIEHVPAAD